MGIVAVRDKVDGAAYLVLYALELALEVTIVCAKLLYPPEGGELGRRVLTEDVHLALFLLCLYDFPLYHGVIVLDGALHGGEGGGYLS